MGLPVGMTFLQVTGFRVGTSLQVISNLVGLTVKNQAAVGNGLPVQMTFLQVTGLRAGMIYLQVTGLQVGTTFLLETFHLAGIWEVGLIMKNQAVVGNGL